MSSTHVLTCSVCHSTLLIENRDAVGGMSMPNLVLLDSVTENATSTQFTATFTSDPAAPETTTTNAAAPVVEPPAAPVA